MENTTRTADAIRECAADLIRLIDAGGGDPAPMRDQIIASIKKLLLAPDLESAGLHRPANHSDDSWILYFDPKLLLVLGKGKAGLKARPHNHGHWTAIGVYKGGPIRYRDYHRVDDRSKAGHAELRLSDDRILGPGEVGVAGLPPHDIHGVDMLGDSLTLAISGGSLLPAREYYDVASNKCTVVQERVVAVPEGDS